MNLSSSCCLAAAQSASVPCDVPANLQTHLRFIAAAQAALVDVLVFPELSLTGYELPHLDQHLLSPEDAVLAPLRALVDQGHTTVVVGAPAATPQGLPGIAAFIYTPGAAPTVYFKQHLHPGEDQHVASPPRPTPRHRLESLGGMPWALCVCADLADASHAASAAAQGAQLYLASALISENGYAADAALLQGHARQGRMGVLLANHAAPSGGYVSAGRSAFWGPDGTLVVSAPGAGDALVLARHSAQGWTGEVLSVENEHA